MTLDFKSTHKQYITGRGNIFVVNLKDYGLENTRTVIRKWMGKECTIDGDHYIIKGIEAFAWTDDIINNNIGILVGNILS